MEAIIKKTRNKQFRFVLKGDNGEPIATSETYTRKEKAVKTLKKYFPKFSIKGMTKYVFTLEKKNDLLKGAVNKSSGSTVSRKKKIYKGKLN